MLHEIEHHFTCPHCFQEVSMVIETEISQSYIEDCEVCCRPIEITFEVNEGQLIAFHCEPGD